jgi:hypothetical protein
MNGDDEMRLVKVVVALAALGSLALPALAQEPLAAPPVMRITVEDIKPGSMGTHEKSVASYLALYSRAQVPLSRLGMVPVSGDQNQVVYLEGFPSFEALEATDKKLEAAFAASPAMQAELDTLDRNGGPLHSSQRTMIAVFRPDLSYRPLSASAVGKSRYFGVTTSRVKLGHAVDYESYTKQLNRARDKADVAESTAVYQVTSGGPILTFMTFTANRSLAELDAARAGMVARNKAVDEALGGEEVVRQRRELAEATFMDVRSVLYALNPRLGTPVAQIASADPDFWAPKVTGKALAVKKEEPKK